MEKYLLIVAVVTVVAVAAFAALTLNSPAQQEYHVHADFALYINGERFNFSQEKYMSTNNTLLSNFVHIHDLNGNVVHFHRQGIDLAFFFRSLGMRFNETCLKLDDGRQFCSGQQATLRFFVNGQENKKFGSYIPSDLDKILITFGPPGENVSQQLASISSDACIYSGKCPERGVAPEELSCAEGSTSCKPEPLENYK